MFLRAHWTTLSELLMKQLNSLIASLEKDYSSLVYILQQYMYSLLKTST